VWVDHPKRTRFPCPVCDADLSAYDHAEEQEWPPRQLPVPQLPACQAAEGELRRTRRGPGPPALGVHTGPGEGDLVVVAVGQQVGVDELRAVTQSAYVRANVCELTPR
jgi:hypothetical protein